tara:strand:- start:744 stop:1259 length:516 start_codon:yes stop_codon:yes gene_type:complete
MPDIIRKRHSKRPLLQAELEVAMKNSKSNKGAARFLGVSYNTYKKYAKLYKDESGQTLFDKHRNWYGRGIPKVRDLGKIPLEEILEGKHPTYPRWKLRERLVKAGYLEGACQNCGYCETRITDGRSPLLLEFTDEDTNNLTVENLYELCYNCHFQIIGGLNQKKSNKLHGI